MGGGHRGKTRGLGVTGRCPFCGKGAMKITHTGMRKSSVIQKNQARCLSCKTSWSEGVQAMGARP